MKTFFTFFILAVLLVGKDSPAATVTVRNAGFTFSPSTITINVGDEVSFVLELEHNAVQVSKSTWDANGNTSNGGFNLPFGGGKVTFNTAGTFYYVCAPHASFGMKGQIIVTAVTGIQEKNSEKGDFLSVYPNPATDFFTLSFNVSTPSSIKIDMMDITGRKVKSLVASKFSSGTYTSRFSTEGLIPGRYFIRYQYGDKSKVALLLYPGPGK